ncbi:MAG TPA: MarR family transcriptional regulator [Candidatus Dormibacteraeota bacterium]
MSQISQAELVELLPLLSALSKAMSRRSHDVPDAIKSEWHRFGLAPRHLNVMILLALAGPLSVSQLSSRLEVGLPSASLLVGELGRVGVVVRQEDERDRRRTIVDLAPAHREAVMGFVSRRAGIIESALESLEPTERAALIKGLRALVTALEAAATEEPQLVRQRG